MKQTDKEALLRALYRYEAKASEVPDAANPGVSDKMEKKTKKIISSAGAPAGGKRAGKSLKIIAVAAAAAIALTAAVAALAGTAAELFSPSEYDTVTVPTVTLVMLLALGSV